MTRPVPMMSEDDRTRFWSKVNKGRAFECWQWTGTLSGRAGLQYGTMRISGETHRAHRIAYFLKSGLANPELVRHKCDNPICVNPNHLESGTHQDNVADAVLRRRDRGFTRENRDKTHCRMGHPLSGDNLYIKPKGWRVCRTCATARMREYLGRCRAKRALLQGKQP